MTRRRIFNRSLARHERGNVKTSKADHPRDAVWKVSSRDRHRSRRAFQRGGGKAGVGKVIWKYGSKPASRQLSLSSDSTAEITRQKSKHLRRHPDAPRHMKDAIVVIVVKEWGGGGRGETTRPRGASASGAGRVSTFAGNRPECRKVCRTRLIE